MSQIKKNIVLLLGHNSWQERSLVLTLKLGGYQARVVNVTDEVINAAQTMPDTVHCVVVPGSGCQRTLKDRLEAFSIHNLAVPVFLVGLSERDLAQNKALDSYGGRLKVSCCCNDQLLASLEQV